MDDSRKDEPTTYDGPANMAPDGIIESNWNEVVDNFDDMNLKEELLRGIYAYGFERPSAIQQRAILPCIKQHDVIAQAQSENGPSTTNDEKSDAGGEHEHLNGHTDTEAKTEKSDVDILEISDENISLLRSILTQLKNLPYDPYKSGIERINWDMDTIENRSIDECKKQLQLIVDKVKKHRTLKEVLQAYIKCKKKDDQQKGADENPPENQHANPPTRPATRLRTRVDESKKKSVRNRNSHGMCDESAVTSSDIIGRETIDKNTRKRKTVKSEAKVTGGNGRKKTKTEPQVDKVDKDNLKCKKQPMKGKAVPKKKFSNGFCVEDESDISFC